MSRKSQRKKARAKQRRILIRAGIAVGALAICMCALWLFLPRADVPAAADIAPVGTLLPTETPEAMATAEPTAQPTPLVPEEKRTATIRFLGDLVIHKAILASAYDKASGYDFGQMFSLCTDLMGDCDLTVANVDGCFAGWKKGGYTGYPHFNSPTALLDALKAAGVDALTMGNNHMLDYEFDGYVATMDSVEAAGLYQIGGARNAEERKQPKIIDANGVRVGFLNYTDIVNGRERYITAEQVEFGVPFIKTADFRAEVKALREAGAEVVVAYLHWGAEYEREANTYQKKTAKQLAQAGVDVIVGGHPHVVQAPVEWIETNGAGGAKRKTLVIYSIGNFLSNQPERYRDAGVVFEFTLSEKDEGGFEVTSPRYMPTYYWTRGTEMKDFTIRVVPVGDYLDTPPEGMNADCAKRMKQVWQETTALLGKSVAQSAGSGESET